MVLLRLASNTNSSVPSLARRHTPEHEPSPGLYILHFICTKRLSNVIYENSTQ